MVIPDAWEEITYTESLELAKLIEPGFKDLINMRVSDILLIRVWDKHIAYYFKYVKE